LRPNGPGCEGIKRLAERFPCREYDIEWLVGLRRWFESESAALTARIGDEVDATAAAVASCTSSAGSGYRELIEHGLDTPDVLSCV
jgi:hypothetical protein